MTVTTDDASLVVAAELWFACHSCLLRSPLDAIEPNAPVECHRCGERQQLPNAYYEGALQHVHAVALRPVTGWMTEEPFGEHLVRVGFSAVRCPTCASFGVRWEGRKGAMSITCGEHGTATYDATGAWSLYKRLAAVITPAHRTDVRHAPARGDRRAKASVCPTCAAPLVRGVGQSFATCTFCATTSQVTPPRSRASDPAPVRMTMLFASEAQ